MNESTSLIDRLRSLDPEATEVLSATGIAWVRTRLGVIGEIRVPDAMPVEGAPQFISEEVERAHALLDQLPLSMFRRSDMWNLLLFITVPYFEAAIPTDLAMRLEAECRGLVGSRKVLLWKEQHVESYLQPLAKRSSDAMGADDPLREALLREARDDTERRALDILFKRRLEESDIEELVRALGRENHG